ncbi:heavy metal-binding domain-containing protein [Methylomarinum sp. Ch1-1]|uniref:UPF0145 protein Q9L42_013010 n=1 Tax=Methylomarinum roseum TaxID=3067653 RepID=A0AAU7NQM4_9GAMM
MIVTTSETIPDQSVAEILGVVSGNVVQSKHIGRDLMAGLKSIVGGELKGYTELLADARNQAIARMLTEAERKNADAIVNVRFSTSQVMEGAAEIMVYGTAVKLKS